MSKNSWMDLAKWYNSFGYKELNAREAINKINPGMKLFLHSGCSEPQLLSQELVNQASRLRDIEIHHFLSVPGAQIRKLHDTRAESFRYNAYFLADNSLREAVKAGKADFSPMMLSEIPEFFRKGRKTIDVALIQVSPPDKNNFCSFGANVDVAKPLAEVANLIIAEVNPNVPRVLGNSFIHMSKIDHFIYSENPLLEVQFPPSKEIYKKIGKNVASLVRNGATLQVGMGKAPQAVFPELTDHSNLGVHTDSFFDGFVDLIEAGVITNEFKAVNKGRCIASFAMGTEKLFKFIDDNLGVEFHPASFTNNPLEIAKNSLMTSINGALSIDLLGQVNAESIEGNFYSGYGGLVDFCRGSMYAEEGVSIICLPSTAKGEEISRILPQLSAGEHVSLTMADVHYIVTEYGIAQLHGKNIRERALALISIAHPKFRQELLEKAKEMNLCYADQSLATGPDGTVVIYPEQYNTIFQTRKGEVNFRPIRATDERLVQDLYYSLDNESRTYRFFRPKKFFSREDVKMDILIDYEQVMALGGVIGEVGHEKMVATCSFEKDNKRNLAEIAFTVHNEWRNLGLTKYMLQYLIKIAKQKGIQGFFREIMWDNKTMAHIIKESGYEIKGYAGEDGWRFKFLF